MGEKTKDEMLICIILVAFVLILIPVIGGILRYKALVENVDAEQRNSVVYQDKIPVNKEEKVDEYINND